MYTMAARETRKALSTVSNDTMLVYESPWELQENSSRLDGRWRGTLRRKRVQLIYSRIHVKLCRSQMTHGF